MEGINQGNISLHTSLAETSQESGDLTESVKASTLDFSPHVAMESVKKTIKLAVNLMRE